MDPTDYSYLLSRQSDPERLRRIAFEEFVRTRNSGRMVGFVGSYASKHLGYPEWRQMVQDFIENNEKRAKALATPPGTLAPQTANLFAKLREDANNKPPLFQVLDLMDLAELLGKVDKRATPDAYKTERLSFAGDFALHDANDVSGLPNVALALSKRLGLTRFMTLNYDLELEWAIFQSDYERLHGEAQRATTWQGYGLKAEGKSLRLERAIAGRGRVTSDVVSREDNAQLIEFALDSPVLHSRIMHMHGRQDDPLNLLVTRRDYRDRYWQNGFSKLPFEYGMRLIFAGNPILFVGLGGNEGDVMRELEQLLSDNPNRRAVPMFMLWNSSGDLAKDNLRRLTFYRRYGIHLLFDIEIAECAGEAEAQDYRVACQARSGDLLDAYRLEHPIEMLADIAEKGRGGRKWDLPEFRTPQVKYEMAAAKRPNRTDPKGPSGKTYRVDIWRHVRAKSARPGTCTVRIDGAKMARPKARIVAAAQNGAPIKVFIGGPGSGRGALANTIADAFAQYYEPLDDGRVVVVNGAFATETDSIFGILSGAFDEHTAQKMEISRARSIRQMYESTSQLLGSASPNSASTRASPPLATPPSITIIINGIERFLAHDGSALSNELDVLIRLIIRQYQSARQKDPQSGVAAGMPPPVSLILIGTQRAVRYLSVVAPDLFDKFDLARDAENTVVSFNGVTLEIPCKCYFTVVAEQISRAAIKPDPSGGKRLAPPVTLRVPALTRDSSANRRLFFSKIFDGAFPAGQGVTHAGLAFEMLRVLAYIGQPTEEAALWHAPSLRIPGTPAQRVALTRTMAELKALGLVLDLQQFPGLGKRIGLHKTVIAEIRERYGVPMSDSRLANGFNLSLYTAQPVDTYMPEQRWHQELAKLADFLMGAHRDPDAPDPDLLGAVNALAPEIAKSAALNNLLGGLDAAQRARLAARDMSECLRAALSLLRSYYSVPALLMHSNRDFDPWMRDGPLTEHADRIQRLIRVCEQACAIRSRIVEHDARLKDRLGPGPLYPDDLVWLNNELGVVRTTQGSLYEARRAFNAAGRANNAFVEWGEQQQNWRRIELNQVQIDIDRGSIERAEDRIRDIEIAIEAQADAFRPRHLAKEASCIADILMTSARALPDGRPTRIDAHYPTDLILATAIAQGYRGLCQHLRGALEASRASFEVAMRILVNLNEQRAYAFFQRHYASVLVTMGETAHARDMLKLSIAAAGPARQTDIDHAGRVSLGLCQLLYEGDAGSAELRKFIPQLTETLRYATTSDMFRLQVEAMQTLAAVHLRNGDGDSALRFATDALAVATRCGFGLRKVSLRILVGRIMGFRKDIDAARELLTSASMVATKIHYERAVESAENERVALGQ